MPTTNAVKPTNDPSSDQKGMLNKAYNELLGRDIGKAGLEWWGNDLKKGHTMNDIRSGITQSAEFKNRLKGNTSAPSPQQATVSRYTPEQREVKSTATVRGQMEGLLSEGSKYLDIARQNSAEQANNRGFLNSSMAAGAGERAAIEAALPIASQDAGTYNQRDLTNMQNVNQSRQFNATADMQTSQFNAGQANQMNQAQWSQGSQQAHDSTMANLNADLERGLIDQKAFANLRGQYLDSITQLAKERAISINEIQTNANIPVEEKQQMIANLDTMFEADLDGTSNIFSQMPMWQRNWSEAFGGGSENSQGTPNTSQWQTPGREVQAVQSLYRDFGWEDNMTNEGLQYWVGRMREGVTGDALRQEFEQAGNENLAAQGGA